MKHDEQLDDLYEEIEKINKKLQSYFDLTAKLNIRVLELETAKIFTDDAGGQLAKRVSFIMEHGLGRGATGQPWIQDLKSIPGAPLSTN